MASRRAKTEKLRRILEVIKQAGRSLWPKEIARLSGLKHSTVRGYLRQLLKAGVLLQPERGLYVINPTHGVGRPPRIHNLWLSVGLFVPRSFKTSEVYGDCKLQVIFGAKRSRVTAVISSEKGLDYTGCCFAIQRVKAIIKEILNVEVENSQLFVRNCEFNEDYVGIRLEGLNCVTVKSFLGSLERMYNKGDGLRNEVKVRPEKVETILALLKGGITPYYAVQGVFLVEKRLEELTKAIKFQNEGIQELRKVFSELLDRLKPL